MLEDDKQKKTTMTMTMKMKMTMTMTMAKCDEYNSKSIPQILTTKGHLEFDVEIPIALKQLATLPTIDDLLARLDTAKREIVAHMPKISWTFMDYYYYWM